MHTFLSIAAVVSIALPVQNKTIKVSGKEQIGVISSYYACLLNLRWPADFSVKTNKFATLLKQKKPH